MNQYFDITVGKSTTPFIGRFVYTQGKDSLIGRATMTVPPDAGYLSILDEGTPVKVAAGTDGLDFLFNGKTSYLDRTRREILVELVDNGIAFKKPYQGDYQKKSIEAVMQEIAGLCGFVANLDQLSSFVKEKLISRSPYVERSILESPANDAPTGDTSSTISGTFTPDCPKCRESYDIKNYVSSVENRCAKCGRSYSLKYQDNEFFCEACGTHFCGIDGYEKIERPVYKLSFVYGPAPGEIYAQKPKYSSSGVSCEEELFRICSANDLYVYKTPNNELVVREFIGFPYPDYVIDYTSFDEDTYKKLKPTLTKLCGVDVAYNGGTISQDIKNITDGPSKRRIQLSRVDLDKTSAQALAKDTLLQQMKETHSELEITVPLNAGYVPGKWIQVPFFSEEFPFNIISSVHRIETGKYSSNLKFKLYPELFELTDLYTDKYKDTLTFELMMKTAEAMSFGFLCDTAACIGHKKIGDTKAMSYWLSDKLKKLTYRSRIIEYTNPVLESKKEYYTQYYENGDWKDIDYSNFDIGFKPAQYKENIRIVSQD